MTSSYAPTAPGVRPDTTRGYRVAVDRALSAMRHRLDENLSLAALSRVAHLSPYHFHRVFRSLTGIPPGRFLGALRLQEAMRWLLTTDRSVTDICFDVGYNSLGTFTSRFTEWVGVPPTRLRALGHSLRCSDLREAADAGPDDGTPVEGRIGGHGAGPVIVGLFERQIPQGRPLACALLAGPGSYRLNAPADGRLFVLAAALGLPPGPDPLLREASIEGVALAGPLTVRGGRARGRSDLWLRPHRGTDPPLLLALPVVLRQEQEAALKSA
jgi:AraC-like DNA-binding protein